MDEFYNLTQYSLVCFSHLRWNFVYQRPQHLMTRCAKLCRVFYIEEPFFSDEADHYELKFHGNICVVTPVLCNAASERSNAVRIKDLLNELFRVHSITKYVFWYYTPMALAFTDQFDPQLIIYDCMDELSAFRFAPAELKELEMEMFRQADLVFTGGQSLFEHKKPWHHNIYPLPSSIDKEHFGRARKLNGNPVDQEQIPYPRFGYYGVIDERLDVELINKVALEKPDWHFIFIGPIVKIDSSSLPKHPNIHYLGSKSYKELPFYIAGWDIALIPFARNESTQFISPTKTPEYLAGGKPVISSSIKDIVDLYGVSGLVKIADTSEEFIRAGESILLGGMGVKWLENVDYLLAGNSWDKTWATMLQLMTMTMDEKRKPFILKTNYYV